MYRYILHAGIHTCTCTPAPWRAWSAADDGAAELIDATLLGKDQRLVARCDVPAILVALKTFGVYSISDFRSALDDSFNALQLALGSAAPPSFLSLVKTQLSTPDSRYEHF